MRHAWVERDAPLLRLLAGLAAVAYLPLLATRPGWVSADTKTYLYLDPGQLLRRAPSMWDPSVGMGTVTHQRIGFLWPMGPFYWLAETAGLPDWVAQRLWWGSIIFFAGAGVAYLLRTLGWKGPGVTAAVFTYALSPVILTLVARLSGVLLPFAGLPWLVALTVQTLRHKGWRHPALFALTVATFGSVNATGLLLVGLAPALWLPYAVWGSREVRARQALLAGLKIAVPTVAVSAWWIAGLNVQRTHGIDIIRYTESAKTVASASVSNEVWRGLGYWFFYGRDRLGPWIEPSYGYTQWPHLIALTYLIPLLGIAGAVFARWQHRAYFVLLILVGLTLGVGAYPWDANPPFGRLVQRFQETDAGLAMRSLPRAVPLVALGTAVLLGAGVTSLVRRWPSLSRPAAWTAVVLAVLTLPPLWLGQFVPRNLRRHEEVPTYWRDAADHLDERGDDTRVLVVPGSDFAAYRWGNTVDPILPGLAERPSVQRETVPNGTAASANLLNALDLTLQEGTAEPAALAPIARLLRAGDLLVVSDWQYERNSLPEPRRFWELVQEGDGLGRPTAFESAARRRSVDRDRPPELAVVPVDDTPSIVAAQPTAHPVLVAGDGAGLVDAAAAGLIDGTELIRYTAPLTERDVERALDDGAVLLLTDSNRKRGERWNTLRHTRGHTETVAGAALAADPNDNRLPLFPSAEGDTDTQTVVVRRGGISAEATSYGNAITYVPADRPMLAVDGDPATAWRTAAFADARGERIELTLSTRVTTDEVRLRQPDGEATRRVTRVRLRFDGADPVVVDLDRGDATVRFPSRSFSQLAVEIVADSAGGEPSYAGHSGIGFAEIEVGGIPNPDDPGRETVRLPVDLLEAAGAASLDHPLAVSLTRQRLEPADRGAAEEPSLQRTFTLPSARRFGLTGTARLATAADSATIGELLARPEDGTVPVATSDTQPDEGVVSSAPFVFDGDPATAWAAMENAPSGQWVEVELPEPVTVSTLPLTVVTDDDHSLPTRVTVSVDGEELPAVDLPLRDETGPAGTTATVDVDLGGEVTGRTFRVTVDATEARVADDAVYGDPIPPVAIAELGLPGPTIPALPEAFDSGCRADLLTIGDDAVPVRVQGTMADALAARPLAVSLCGDEVELHGGDNHLATARGRETGIDLDRLVLRSAAGGAASAGGTTLAAEAAAVAGGEPATPPPLVEVRHDGASDLSLHVTGATPGEPFWLVLGQSYSPGWSAALSGDSRVTGPQLVDGFANGWLVTPSRESFDATLTFTPQQGVDRALWLSLGAAVACIALALRPVRRAAAVAPAVPAAWAPAEALRFQGTCPSPWRARVIAVGLGVLAWFVAGPAVGLVVGVAAAVTARRADWRRWLLLASPASLALAGLYVILAQILRSPEPGLDWPFQMRQVHLLGWLAALLLIADVVISAGWRNGGGSYLGPTGNQMPLGNDVSVEGEHPAELVNSQ